MIVELIKQMARFVIYPQQRMRIFNDFRVNRIKKKAIRNQYKVDTKKLIIFLVPGAQWETGKEKISGGLISICSFYDETKKLTDVHGSEVVMVTHKEDGLIDKFMSFENNIQLYGINLVFSYFKNLEEVVFNVPEFLVERLIPILKTDFSKKIKRIRSFHINVMNQNIRLMPGIEIFSKLNDWADKVTITTAHQKYTSSYYRDLYKVPIHKLSVWISPEQYDFKTFESKENLMVVSPDFHPDRIKILEGLKKIKGLEIIVIENLTYESYKKLISKAKWSLTFGEGLDGYFIEPVFSGAISFAVYNEQFFTTDFSGLPTVYVDVIQLQEKIESDIEKYNNQILFDIEQKKLYEICAKHYNHQNYVRNIELFYKREYTYG